MKDYFPLFAVGAIVGIATLVCFVAFAFVKSKKEAFGFERNMKDGELIKRLMVYAKPYAGSFVAIFFLMLAAIAYDVISPTLVGRIEEMIRGDFALKSLFVYIGAFVSMLVVSAACSYFQSIILQRTGQKIISSIREDLFSHIESLSHGQLNEIPVGKLVTRVSNDCEAISRMFTQVIFSLVKN